MNIPLYIIITKPNVPKYENTTFICSSLEECKNKLIIKLKNEIIKFIDYPDDIDDFITNYWYTENYMNNEFFDYNIFYNNEWIKPWTTQELYDTVIDIINKIDIQDSIYNDNNYYDDNTE